MGTNASICVVAPKWPYNWYSFWHLVPAQLDALKALPDFKTIILDDEPLNSNKIKVIEKAKAIILVYGAINHGGLDFLKELSQKSGKLPPLLISTNGEGARGCLSLIGYREALNSTRLLLPACNAEKVLIEQAFPDGPEVRVKPVAVRGPAKKFTVHDRKQFKHALNLKDSDPLLVYSGRLSMQKNIHLLLASFALVVEHFPSAKLYLLGAPDDLGLPHFGQRNAVSYASALTKMVAELKLQQSVVFTGLLGQETLLNYLQACDLQVSFTTHYGEDFGYSIAQGMACGAATLVTNWGGGLDFVRNGGALGLPTKMEDSQPTVDFEGAAEKLLEILEPEELKKWSKAANKYYDTFLSVEVVAKSWNGLVKEVEANSIAPFEGPLTPAPTQLNYYNSQRSAFEADKKSANRLFESAKDPVYQDVIRAYAGIYPGK